MFQKKNTVNKNIYTWNSLSGYFRKRFGCRVQKISLDIASSCPNRTKKNSNAGCTFCNPLGSGTGLGISGLTISEQWAYWHKHYSSSHKCIRFIAYLQSFSNTYGTIDSFTSTLSMLNGLPDMVGISVGTRPDCVSEQKLQRIVDMPYPEKWVEFGVQTVHDATLIRIRRGHSAVCSEQAIEMASRLGLLVCAHVMFGLPGETPEQMLETVDRLNMLPIHGIKFHNVYVAQNTTLEQEFMNGLYAPLTEDVYTELIVESLCRLRPDIVVHRVVADPYPGELVAPGWAEKKNDLVRSIEKLFQLKKEALHETCEV